MKRVALLFTILFVMVSSLSAQQLLKKRVGVYTESGSTVVAEANTMLAIDLTIRYEEFVKGPYARYAQKFLGSRAPQVDYINYEIVGAEVSVAPDGYYMLDNGGEQLEELLPLGLSFPDVLPDKLSMQTLAPEQAAEKAAEKIIELRNVRLELISGEYGDGVYGAGLESALRQIDMLEKSYMELFYGKSEARILHKRIYLPVDAERKSQIAARFNAEQGLLGIDNLDGDIVMVAIHPSAMEYPESNVKGKATYRYANNATVIVSLGQRILTSRVLPIYEYGQTILH
jgi:hypothetical protein